MAEIKLSVQLNNFQLSICNINNHTTFHTKLTSSMIRRHQKRSNRIKTQKKIISHQTFVSITAEKEV